MAEPLKFKAKLLGDGRLEMVDADSSDAALAPPSERSDVVRPFGEVVSAYLRATERLAKEKYSHIKDWIPVHLSDPSEVLVLLCLDGVVVRFERNTDNPGVIAGWAPNSLTELVPVVSQQIIHCYTDRNFTSVVPTVGPTITIQKTSADTGLTEDIGTARIGFDVVLERPAEMPRPPNKPLCLVSVRNIFEIETYGIMTPIAPALPPERQFVARSIIRLPVEWECIEVYPFPEPDQWKPEYASVWAENDILAAVVANQFRERHFETLDPNASARLAWSTLLKSYKDLLDSKPEREETLQTFLRENPALLCQTQIRAWPKLALGARETDFVFHEAASDYLLVELEKSTDRLFLQDGHPSAKLTHACGQIVDWKRYLEDNLRTVQSELGLAGISTNPKSLVVIGRSDSLTDDNRRKLVTMENEAPKRKIMTYDDVYDNAQAVIENLLGPITETGGSTRMYYF